MSTNTRRLDTVLKWERVTRWRYHVEKGAHSAFIGLALWCVLPFRHGLVAAMLAGALVYLVVGKLTLGRTHHPAIGLEVLDWIADFIIGAAGAALAIWGVYGWTLGLAAVATWVLLYVVVAYRWAVP